MKTSFKIPLQTEVEMYMKEKMGWDDKFIRYYADKFWNHYQASGWKLSNGNRIKDWKACFNSQWKQPKYKEDIEKLNGVVLKQGIMENSIKEVQELDELLEKYSQHPTSVPFREFGKYYDFLKAEKLLKPFSKMEVSDIQGAYGEDKFLCRCACVQLTIQGYVDSGFTFSKVFELRQKLTQ